MRALPRSCPCLTNQPNIKLEKTMPKYIIEREIPNAAALSAADLKGISQKSCGVLQQLGQSIQWVQS